MDHKERDHIIRKKILNEIADIESFVMGLNEETFTGSKLAQKAVVMSLINIGELSKAFSEEYIEKQAKLHGRPSAVCETLPRIITKPFALKTFG